MILRCTSLGIPPTRLKRQPVQIRNAPTGARTRICSLRGCRPKPVRRQVRDCCDLGNVNGCRRRSANVFFTQRSNACDVSSNVLGRTRTCNDLRSERSAYTTSATSTGVSKLFRPPSAHRGTACSVWLWGRKESNLPAHKALRFYRPLRAPARVRPQVRAVTVFAARFSITGAW